jgi:N-acetylneuraminate synthase
VIVLQCTTEYPAPIAEANLRAMAEMHDAFGLPVGYSDHTIGSVAAVAAVALGATMVEKHFTLDRTLPGPDHAASLEPDELAAYVSAVRDARAALGSPVKVPSASETKNIPIARKSVVASRPITAGEILGPDNMTTKRPATGRDPFDYFELLGTVASRDYATDELL